MKENWNTNNDGKGNVSNGNDSGRRDEFKEKKRGGPLFFSFEPGRFG
jgi:hypothetical protein